MLFYPDCEEDIILLIGRLELAKREMGWTEVDMYELQLTLKNSESRKKIAEEKHHSELELEKLYHDLKKRRKLYKELRRKSREKKRSEKITQQIKEELESAENANREVR